MINLLQPVQESRFHELTKRETAPTETKAKTFTGKVSTSTRSLSQSQITEEMVSSKLKSSVEYHIEYYRKLIF